MDWTIRNSKSGGSKGWSPLYTRLYRPRGPLSLLQIQWTGPFPGVERPDHDFDYPPSSSYEISNKKSYTLNPFRVFMAFDLVMIMGYHQRMSSVTTAASISCYISYGYLTL